MSRLRRLAVIGLVLIITIYAQDLAIRLLGPTSDLYLLIADVTWPVDGDQWAQELYVAITVWFIWIVRVGVIAIGIYREFLSQRVTRQAAAGGVRP